MQISPKRPHVEANPHGTRVAENRPPVISFLVIELCAQVYSGPYLPKKPIKTQRATEIANLSRSLPQAPRMEKEEKQQQWQCQCHASLYEYFDTKFNKLKMT